MSAVETEPSWSGTIGSLAEVGKRLQALREETALDGPGLRTSVLTHIAWVPPEWEQAATDTLAGLADRHPSRVILLLPEPDADEDSIEANLALRAFALGGSSRHVACEVIELRLRGQRATSPASIVLPLLVADLPVFLRWRGRPPFGDESFETLVDLVDRLVLDSSEWPDVPEAYGELAERFARTAISDIAWGRGEPWRREIAHLWPDVAEMSHLRVTGPLADAHLLAGWLRSRLGREVELEHDDADALDAVAVDGTEVGEPRGGHPSSSDLLSNELEQFGRDRVYEDAVVNART